jgi:hypothetical protein
VTRDELEHRGGGHRVELPEHVRAERDAEQACEPSRGGVDALAEKSGLGEGASASEGVAEVHGDIRRASSACAQGGESDTMSLADTRRIRMQERRSLGRTSTRAAIVALGLLGATTVLGCGREGDRAPKPDPVASASASASADDDPNAKKKISKQDCERWSEHGVGVLLADVKEAAKACPAEQRDQLSFQFDGQRATLKQAALEVCTKHVGEDYVVKDGRCWALGKTARDLAACKFAPMTAEGDNDLGAAVASVRASCAKAATGQAVKPPPSASK